MKHLYVLLFACAAACAQAGEQQGSTALSGASELAADGSALLVYGSLSAVAASGTVVVDSVEVAGDASLVVLHGASDAGRAAIRLSGRAARGASLAVGTGVSLVAMSTGYLLVSAGTVICFIPNELGKALLHHSDSGPARGRS
jgi:hypothetical protein